MDGCLDVSLMVRVCIPSNPRELAVLLSAARGSIVLFFVESSVSCLSRDPIFHLPNMSSNDNDPPRKGEDEDELKRRLENLTGRPLPIEQKELEERIARLKGIDPKLYTAPPITIYKPSSDHRSEVEQAEDLMNMLMREAAIDDEVEEAAIKRQPSLTDDEIEKRLRGLKGPSLAPEVKDIIEDDDMDSDTEADLTARRLVAEANLPMNEMTVGRASANPLNNDDDQQDLPWCVICNEDAILCCRDCDDDLYCMECFREFHSDSDTRKHKTKALPTS